MRGSSILGDGGTWGSVVMIVLAATSSPAAHGDNWSLLDDQGTPITGHAMVYDEQRGVMLRFGGYGDAGGATWEWDRDGRSWRMVTTLCPPARIDPAMVYDSDRGVVVLFGGYTPGLGYMNETWEWDGVEWIRVCDGTDMCASPSPRTEHGMAYDVQRKRVVLFGGSNGGELGDTWEWNGAERAWTEIEPPNQPSPRRQHAMVYDSARGVVLLFGGYDGSPDDETWVWNGIDWSQVCLECVTGVDKPLPRGWHGLAYDSDKGVAVLFGGWDRGSQMFGDTWEWQGEAWRLTKENGPEPRIGPSMAYDVRERMSLLNGGEVVGGERLGDTWGYSVCCETGSEHLTTSCRQSDAGKRVPKVILSAARGCAGSRVEFSLDEQCPRMRTIKENGKCRVKWKGCNGRIAPGLHVITAVLSCGTVLEQVVECP